MKSAGATRAASVPMTKWPHTDHWADDDPDLDFLHEMASRLSAAPPLAEVLKHVVEFATSVVSCDSCFVYVLEGEVVTKISDQQQTTYSAGQMFYEQPGSTHEVSRNASTTKPAKFLAMIFAKKGLPLVTPA